MRQLAVPFSLLLAFLVLSAGCSAAMPVTPSPTTVPTAIVPTVSPFVGTPLPLLPTSPPDIITMSATPASGNAPLAVIFHVIASHTEVGGEGCLLEPTYDFGDGTYFNALVPSCPPNISMLPTATPLPFYGFTKQHQYARPGTYQAWARTYRAVAMTTVAVQ